MVLLFVIQSLFISYTTMRHAMCTQSNIDHTVSDFTTKYRLLKFVFLDTLRLSYYPNQLWHIVKWTPKNILQCYIYIQMQILNFRKWILKCRLQTLGHFVHIHSVHLQHWKPITPLKRNTWPACRQMWQWNGCCRLWLGTNHSHEIKLNHSSVQL